MPRPLSTILLASALWVLACDSTAPASKSGEGEPTPEPSSASEPDARAQAPELTLESEAPDSSDRPAPPAWFDPAKIEHQAVSKQMASENKVAGGYASAMILELEAGVSDEQCIERAKAALAQSLSELPEATPQGDRLLLQGKTDEYQYTVVCGQANGKPTMYLSYTAQ